MMDNDELKEMVIKPEIRQLLEDDEDIFESQSEAFRIGVEMGIELYAQLEDDIDDPLQLQSREAREPRMSLDLFYDSYFEVLKERGWHFTEIKKEEWLKMDAKERKEWLDLHSDS